MNRQERIEVLERRIKRIRAILRSLSARLDTLQLEHWELSREVAAEKRRTDG